MASPPFSGPSFPNIPSPLLLSMNPGHPAALPAKPWGEKFYWCVGFPSMYVRAPNRIRCVSLWLLGAASLCLHPSHLNAPAPLEDTPEDLTHSHPSSGVSAATSGPRPSPQDALARCPLSSSPLHLGTVLADPIPTTLASEFLGFACVFSFPLPLGYQHPRAYL